MPGASRDACLDATKMKCWMIREEQGLAPMSALKRPLPFVLVASGHGTFIVNRHDYHMIDAERGYGVGYDILNSSLYKPDEVANALYLLTLRREFFGDGVVAVDCGANIGVHTVEWAKMMQ